MGKRIVEQKRTQDHLKSKGEKLAADKILALYDKDGRGLSRDEVKPLLMNISKEVVGEEYPPKEDDMEFLFLLHDKKDQRGELGPDGKLSKDEMNNVIDTWIVWLKEKDTVSEIFKEFDTDASGRIDKEQLAAIYHAVKPAELLEVPPEVVEWGLKVSDVNGNGGLELIELARALCALERWWNKKFDWPPPPIAKYMVGKDELPEAKMKESQCCTVS